MEQFRLNPIASSSHFPDPLPAVEYEVFLSFRGPDVRTTFADFLYRLLDRPKIRTFLDDEELRKGEKIAPSLVKAIGESIIYIPILSPGYASSKWCLQELALMVERYKQDEGCHIILPIFFLMEPRDVRHCQGSYEGALEQHRLKYGEESIRAWKDALGEVGQMTGWRVTDSDRQGAVAESVFSEVWSHIKGNYMLVTNELIGIDSHVNQVIELLKSDFDCGASVVGIHGMGGIGKTTIAKAVYNKVFTQFERHCFLEDVRETLSLKNDGVTTLQSKIISSILRDDHKVRNASEGIHIMKDRVCPHKVLIILDDVDDRFVFEQILGEVRKFSPESRFIITTRDKRVLELLQVSKLYEPGGLGHDHSLQLIRRHAFRMDNPFEDMATLCEEFVEVAAGLPLALEVIGSLLFRRDRKFWEAKLIELKRIPPTKVQERLKISYDELSGSEKQIFLDIACAFIGENKELPFFMWSDCNFNPESGINTLVLRSLIKVDEDNKFWMHDHIRDLGRMIVREGDDQHPWKRTRIMSNEDAVDMLINGEGTERLEVLRVDMLDHKFELTEKEFHKLSGLRYLEVRYGKLTGDFKEILPSLRWLRLFNCRSIPIDFNVKKLVILDLRDCPVRDDWRCWERIKEGHRLKAIDVSRSFNVTKVPDLFGCTSLEQINFGSCPNMGGELHIGHLKDLRVLSIGWTKITKLIGDIGSLRNLREINVDLTLLREIPASIGKLSSLKILVLGRLENEVPVLPTSLKRLSVSSPRVPNLLELKDLEELWWSCGLEIPEDMSKLSKLKDLTLVKVGNGKDAFVLHKESVDPDNQNHYSLRRGGRTLISSLPALPASLNTLSIDGDAPGLLMKLPNLANLSNLLKLTLGRVGIREIAGLGELRMLEDFSLWSASNLTNLDGLEPLELLKDLRVSDCCVLSKLPSFSNMSMLRELKIFKCPELRELPSLSNLTKLQVLRIFDCPLVSEIQGLGELAELSTLHILRCDQLTEVVGLDKLKSLRVLEIHDCPSIEKLPDLSALELLRKLEITGWRELTEVMGLDNLKSLQELVICDCPWIEKLPDLSASKRLWKLAIIGCNQLTEVTGIERLEGSTYLKIDERLKTRR
ncbi:unnamed protein product [Linum trigynum]|uniref:TIR domain-containing protein n=1 Tax=Linum trigynum TaxID=586398 RepID=A0AAV2CPX6_9ROSI